MTPSEIVHATTQRLHEYKTQLRDWIVGNAAVGANCMLFFLLVETGLVSHVLGVPLSSDLMLLLKAIAIVSEALVMLMAAMVIWHHRAPQLMAGVNMLAFWIWWAVVSFWLRANGDLIVLD